MGLGRSKWIQNFLFMWLLGCKLGRAGMKEGCCGLLSPPLWTCTWLRPGKLSSHNPQRGKVFVSLASQERTGYCKE